MVSEERLSRQPQAGSAVAFETWHAGADCVGAVATDEPPVLVSDHRSEVDSRVVIRAAEGQDRVGRHWSLLHRAKEAGTRDSNRHAP